MSNDFGNSGTDLEDLALPHLLGGENASPSPFQRSLRSLPPLLGHTSCDQGGIPPWIPQTAFS